MKPVRSSLRELREVYERALTVRCIAEPLASFDANHDETDVVQFLDQHGYDLVGIRKCGHVTDYLMRSEGKRLEQRPISSAQQIGEYESLSRAMDILCDSAFLFVLSADRIWGIITRADLQKVPIRMWFFGLVSLLEMNLTAMLRRVQGWENLLSERRLREARELHMKRMEHNDQTDVEECLQICDKYTILAKQGHAVSDLGFSSNTQWYRYFKKIEELRNLLAHSNAFGKHMWSDISLLVRETHDVLIKAERFNQSA